MVRRHASRVIKLLLGLLKGAVIGGGIAYGAYYAKLDLPWVTYGVIGALIGLVAGRPIWSLLRDKNATNWTGILKMAFGYGVGVGLYALVAKVWRPDFTVYEGIPFMSWPLGIAIGGLWGGFIELDDSIGEKPDAGAKKTLPAKTK